jgi:RNA polymerase sigma factor (sigma-70 family)
VAVRLAAKPPGGEGPARGSSCPTKPPPNAPRSSRTRTTASKEERRRAVREALAGLTGEQREAIVLARYHGLPYAEIARTLGTTEGAVKTRIFRAMETLKTRLGGIS